MTTPSTQFTANQLWHSESPEYVTSTLGSHERYGLSASEAERRLKQYGPNVITAKGGKSPLVRFLLQFHNPLLYILLISSLITLLLKDPVDAAIIFGAVLINVILGYIQESRAEKAIEALARAMKMEATVVRDGKTIRLSAAELVPGDVVILHSGDRVPADLRLIHTRDLQIAEAALTGESVPVSKDAHAAIEPDTALADRVTMAYASTLVTYGQGMGIVVATGNQTEVGRISQLIASAHDLQTPLTRKIAEFSRLLLFVILGFAALTMVIGFMRGQPLIDSLIAAIALAVSAIPEGLPAAVTVTLAIGVVRMARRQAIIRKLPAVETLGSTTVICSDKTGTLTQNQMTVQRIVAGGESFATTGSGYQPEGEITLHGAPAAAAAHPALAECLRAGLLCNDSELVEAEGRWDVRGDPTEGALLVAAYKAGIRQEQWLTRLDSIPFESEHQYMATLHDAGPDRERVVYLKGSVEAVLARCETMLDAAGKLVPCDAAAIQRAAEALAGQGLRVLAFARGCLPPGTESITHHDVISGLTFLGLQGMVDPPRPEAITAVRACQEAGIKVKMITGDHALTAAAIAEQIGLERGRRPAVLTGREIEGLTDEELSAAAERTTVFGRVTPEQKLRLVQALQARGHIVAMTGDGVNDAPALKQADIGIAMGLMGTDVAREAADMVLTDDNFATIEAAVEEGRGVFDNLTKIIAWTLPTNVGEGLVILAAILIGSVLPVLPVQILWVNMATVAALGLVLAAERKEPGIMQRRPRKIDAPILDSTLLWRTLAVGLLIVISAFSLFEWELQAGASLAEARTVAVNVIVIIELFYVLNCRSLTHSMFQIGVFSNRWLFVGVGVMILLQLAFTYLPWMNQIMYSAPIGLDAWWRIVAVALIGYLLIELEKWLRRQYANRRQPALA
ncbi:cation-transporting P-type ATPase [Chloroflexus sp.]|uniref:cation-transporting P-type ATPase n=1 Tax=Chloroflexus sp. TaxID=1904827 RepID=UPI002ACE4C80|nr:cation-transporting P-type ATPase [Chloroflexus sp.]